MGSSIEKWKNHLRLSIDLEAKVRDIIWFQVRSLSYSSSEEQTEILQFFYQYLNKLDPLDRVWLIRLLQDHYYRLDSYSIKEFLNIVKSFLMEIEEVRQKMNHVQFSKFLENLGILGKMLEGKDSFLIFETIWNYKDSTNSKIRENVLYITKSTLNIRKRKK